jgi:hypothetical protein
MITPASIRPFLFAALAAVFGSSAFAGEGSMNHAGGLGDDGARANVPVVNCASETDQRTAKPTLQLPPQKATAPASVAPKLAYYTGGFGGVLAPRGWQCDVWFNAGGMTVYVRPHRKDARAPFVQIITAENDANFSQKEIVATVVAHLFPAHAAYVKEVVAQEHENSGDGTYDIAIGPYPADKITRRTATLVEFVTPPNKDGMGTEYGIGKNAVPVFGAAFLASDDSYAQIALVRLPDELKSLAPAILKSAEPAH